MIYKPGGRMEEIIIELIKQLGSDSGIIRQKARFELVAIGKQAIPHLIGLQYSKEQHIRWEAMKTLSQIADPSCIPILIKALENHIFDVRWLAAVALIEIGHASVVPLLEALESRNDSLFLREGAHHVLKFLKSKNEFVDNFGIITMLESVSQHSLLSATAYKILREEELT